MRKLFGFSIALVLILAPLSVEAACMLTCRCFDKHVSGSETQGPFNSTPACMAAVSSMTMRCRSGGPNLMISCSPCMSCEPPVLPSAKAPKSAAPAPDAQQSAWEKSLTEQEAAAQKQFQKDLEDLKGGLKGVDVGDPNEIRLKAPPSGSALRQLDCAREQSMAGGIETHNKDWTYSSECKPVRTGVPPVSAPVPVDTKGRIPQVQFELQQRVSVKRQELVRQDNEISRLEQKMHAEELNKEAPAGESEALRKAREALAKTKADRARTASEISKLEKQEAAASEGKR